MMNLMMWVMDQFDGKLPPPAIIKPRPMWTGKQVLSLVLPKHISYCRGYDPSKNMNWDNPKDEIVLVRNKELLSGYLKKSDVGASKGSLVHIIWKDKSPDETRDWMSHT